MSDLHQMVRLNPGTLRGYNGSAASAPKLFDSPAQMVLITASIFDHKMQVYQTGATYQEAFPSNAAPLSRTEVN